MAHIVFVTGGLTGLLNASLALIQQLRQAGHSVTYASPKDLSKPLAARGIPFVQLASWGPPPAEPSASRRWQKLRRVRSRQQRAITALGVEQFIPTLQSLKPDLLLVDIEMHPHIMAAVMAQVPVALLCPFVSIWRRLQVPPIHTSIVPGRGWRGSVVGIQLSWLRYGWRKWKETQRDRWQKVGCDRNSVLRRYAQQIGYPIRPFIDLPTGMNQWLVPYPHGSSLPILCLHGAELDFPHKPHPTMHYLGSMVADNLSEDLSPPESLIPLKLTESQDNRPLIYCGCSSMLQTNQSFLKQLIEAAWCCPQWDFVLGLGGGSLTDVVITLPTNLYVLQWAHQAQLLEKADCAVINAGAQSLAECIHFGVPMLVYPLNVNDQNGNAARVSYHGLGLVGALGEGAVQLQERIQTLLSDEDYRNRIEEMRDRLQHYRQNQTAVRIVENLLAQPKEHLRSSHRPVKMSVSRFASRLPGRLASCLQGGRQS